MELLTVRRRQSITIGPNFFNPPGFVHLLKCSHCKQKQNRVCLVESCDLVLEGANLAREFGHLAIVLLRHLLHLLSDDILVVKEVCLHLRDLHVLADRYCVLLFDRLFQKHNFLLELSDFTNMICVLVSFSFWQTLCRVVVCELRLGLGHVGSVRLLAVHILLPLLVPVRLLRPLLLLEHPGMSGGIRLFSFGKRSLVGAGTGPAHQL